MATSEQKKKLLKAKIAVALHDELGRVPKLEVAEAAYKAKVRNIHPDKGARANR